MDIEIQMQLIQAVVDEANSIRRHTSWPEWARRQVGEKFKEAADEFCRFGVPAEVYAQRVREHVEANALFMWAVFNDPEPPK